MLRDRKSAIFLTMRRLIFTLSIMFSLLLGIGSGYAATIKKCQDATGKWHYGDYAAEQCEQSRITEIDARGLKVDETLSVGEQKALREEREQLEAKQKAANERRVLDNRLLAMWENEASISYARDQRLASIDNYLNVHQELLNRLKLNLERQQKEIEGTPTKQQTKELRSLEKQIAEYEAAIARRAEERIATENHFGQVLADYQEALQRRGYTVQ